jgi:hypothetical protein
VWCSAQAYVQVAARIQARIGTSLTAEVRIHRDNGGAHQNLSRDAEEKERCGERDMHMQYGAAAGRNIGCLEMCRTRPFSSLGALFVREPASSHRREGGIKRKAVSSRARARPACSGSVGGRGEARY